VYHQADVGHSDAPGLHPVHGHGMPDDDAAADGDQGVDVVGETGQCAEQRRARSDGTEEAQVAGVRGEPGEEVAERGQVFRTRLPDGDGRAAAGPDQPWFLGSVHGPSMVRDC
jgi:hypothetical protein